MSLASENNNPGDLREAGQADSTPGAGGFASFSTPQAGFGALLNDLQAKINKNPSENLVQFSTTYAPAGDGNNPGQYAANLANKLGVSPDATLGSLQGNIGNFAQAVANNEDSNTPAPKLSTASQTLSSPSQPQASSGPSLLGEAGGLLGAAGAGITGLLGLAKPLLPAIGAVGAEALAPEVPGSGIAGGVAGTALENLLGGSSTPQPTDTTTATAPSQPSQTSSDLQDALTQTVGGNAVMQEGGARGINPVEVMEQSGAVPQPDENGNFDKMTPIQVLQNQIGEDKTFQTQALSQMSEETGLYDMEQMALAEADEKMQGSPDLASTKEKIKKTFANYREQQPKEKDQYGNEYIKSFKVSPERLQLMKERSSEGTNWASPPHEREASQHIYTAMTKRLSAIAKSHNIKGWDETNKRMEGRILAIKAIKKLPKKAQRNKAKELRHEIAGALAGALIGKTLGNGLIGGIAGGLIERKLGKKYYKQLGSKKEIKELERLAKTPQRGLIHLRQAQ